MQNSCAPLVPTSSLRLLEAGCARFIRPLCRIRRGCTGGSAATVFLSLALFFERPPHKGTYRTVCAFRVTGLCSKPRTPQFPALSVSRARIEASSKRGDHFGNYLFWRGPKASSAAIVADLLLAGSLSIRDAADFAGEGSIPLGES